MSNKVYHDILEPILKRILQSDPMFGADFRDSGGHRVTINDPNFERFVLQQLIKEFNLNGRVMTDAYGNILDDDEYCKPLELLLRELLEKEYGKEELRSILEQILKLYIRIGLASRGAKAKRSIPNPYFKSSPPWVDKKKRKEGSKTERVRVV